MSSPVTFSGFNNIDFGSITNLMIQQESIPMQFLQAQQSDLKAQNTAFGTLATRLSTLQSAVDNLSSSSDLAGFAATSSDASIASASAGSGAVAGQYEVFVQELARAQVTASATTVPDADTTAVATGG
jgi:flagellar hook-associated protein 2